MSQPKRYGRIVNDCDNWDIGEEEDGDYVLYSDYAALAAQNERLTASVRHYVEQDALRKVGEAIHQQRIESGAYNREKNETIRKLAAENERLRKAGDAMWKWINKQPDPEGYAFADEWKPWDAAKEGRDAK